MHACGGDGVGSPEQYIRTIIEQNQRVSHTHGHLVLRISLRVFDVVVVG